MNLHGIASGATASVNPWVIASIQRSTGYTTSGSGHRTPTYADPVEVKVQMQSLQYNDIQQVDGLNVQGERRAMYIDGDWEGLQRDDQKGGDLILLPDGSIWLVALVAENWQFKNGWVKVICTRQIS